MLTVDTARELLEKRDHDLLELDGVDDVQDLLHFVEEHDFLRRVDLRPEAQETQHNFFRESRILLEELHHAVGELRVVQGQAFHLVERDEHACQEDLVLVLEREGEAIDD